MRRLKGNAVLKELYCLHSVALILVDSSLMLEVSHSDQRELHTPATLRPQSSLQGAQS